MTSEWITARPEYSSIPGVDPAVEWALNDGIDHFFPSEAQQQWMPVLVQFRKEISAKDFEDGKHFVERDDLQTWKDSVHVPRVHIAPPPMIGEPVRFLTALVTRKFFELLWEKKDVRKQYLEFVASVTLGLPLDFDSLPRLP